MKVFWLLFFVGLLFFVCRVRCIDYFLFLYDLEIIFDCVDWFNNDDGWFCKWVCDYFEVILEEFSCWNLFVGFNCELWYEWNLYCVIIWIKINSILLVMSKIIIMSSLIIIVFILGFLLIVWIDMGCYVEDLEFFIFDVNFNFNGDLFLSVFKCW